MHDNLATEIQDIIFMKKALLQAQKAAKEGEVPVGAVIVYEGTVIAHGRNKREASLNALSHAETEAIKKACRRLGRWRLTDCTLYVTLEPCPMCAGAIINSRISRIVYGAHDQKAGSCGSVINLFDLPYNHKPKLTTGVCSEQCSKILSDFFKNLRKNKIRN